MLQGPLSCPKNTCVSLTHFNPQQHTKNSYICSCLWLFFINQVNKFPCKITKVKYENGGVHVHIHTKHYGPHSSLHHNRQIRIHHMVKNCIQMLFLMEKIIFKYFAKVFVSYVEKIVHNQLLAVLHESNILEKFQLSFVKITAQSLPCSRSPTTCC